MIIKHYTDVEEEKVTMANSTNTTIRWLITHQDGAERYTTRRFEIQPGGQIGLHNHPEEHHIYILRGHGVLIDEDDNSYKVEEGNIIYVPPNEPHGYLNRGKEVFSFLCVIPYLKNK